MGRRDQGNKAQTPIRYSHGTVVSTGGPVTAVTRVFPRRTLGVRGLCWYPCTRAVRVCWGMARQDGRRVGPRQHPRRRGLGQVLLADGDWCSRGGVGTAHGPREEIGEGAEASPGPGADTGGYQGHSRAPGTVWWEYWGTRGSTGDSMVGVLWEAWRCWGLYGGSSGGSMAVPGTKW